MKPNQNVLPKENIKALLRLNGRAGDILTGAAMSITGMNRINRTFKEINGLMGFQFAEASLKSLGVTAIVNEEELGNIPKTGPFIICSNHPFGGIDGLMLMSIVGRIRPDVMFMVNHFLMQIPNLNGILIPVNAFSSGKAESISGVKSALEHLSKGGGLVMFPAGEVSSDRNAQRTVKDIDWQRGSMKLIRKASVPVIPVYFEGSNSWLFHKLGAIHPILRTIRLPRELLNKKGSNIRISFGKSVNPVEFSSYHTPEELGAYLRNRSYALEGLLPASDCRTSEKLRQPIEAHIDKAVLKAELDSIESSLIYREGSYSCYLNRFNEIPNIIREIGVCREETFRNNGEGTGKAIDLDEYDRYYLHLHLWNEENCELVGAYRVGLGDTIMRTRGIKGFYSDLFFHFKEGMSSMLEESIELGRSFIVDKYQLVPNALKMLLTNGVGRLGGLYPEMKYFFGPASISSDIPPLYSSLIVEHLRRTRFESALSNLVEADIPFVPEFGNLDVDALRLERMSIYQFDKCLRSLSGGRYRVPTLIRAYIKHGCTFLGFNIDPDFNYCIDALLMVKIERNSEDEQS